MWSAFPCNYSLRQALQVTSRARSHSFSGTGRLSSTFCSPTYRSCPRGLWRAEHAQGWRVCSRLRRSSCRFATSADRSQEQRMDALRSAHVTDRTLSLLRCFRSLRLNSCSFSTDSSHFSTIGWAATGSSGGILLLFSIKVVNISDHCISDIHTVVRQAGHSGGRVSGGVTCPPLRSRDGHVHSAEGT